MSAIYEFCFLPVLYSIIISCTHSSSPTYLKLGIFTQEVHMSAWRYCHEQFLGLITNTKILDTISSDKIVNFFKAE